MRKSITTLLAAALVLCLFSPALAASPATTRTVVSLIYAPAEPIYFVEASVKKLNGNQNELTITITEWFTDGTENVISESFMIKNNAADTYIVGGYSIYVDTKGNIQIRQCEVVDTP